MTSSSKDYHSRLLHQQSSTIAPITFLLILAIQPITSIYKSQTDDRFLFYTSPGSGSYRAGLYGGAIGPLVKDTGKVGGQPVGSMRQFGYECFEHAGRDLAKPDKYELSELRSVSYDERTGRVLLFSDKSAITLVNVPACRTFKHQCANKSRDQIEVLLDQVSHDHYPTIKPGPFASHDAQLYFILEKTDRAGEPGGLRSATIELRRIRASCHDKFPVSSHTKPFDWFGCSELLATLSEEKNVKHLTYRPMDSLFISEPEDDSSGKYLDVYTQMHQLRQLNNEGDIDANAVLYLVRVSTKEQPISSTQPEPSNSIKAKELYRQSVSSGHSKYLLYHLGGLTLKQGNLCWSAVDVVLCGRVQAGGGVKDTKTAIPSSDIRKVCIGPEPLNTVVTGLVINEVNLDQLILYFGCWAAAEGGDGYGGTGVARVHLGSSTLVEKLREPPDESKPKNPSGNPVLGAGLFMTHCKVEGPALAGVTSGVEIVKMSNILSVVLFFNILFSYLTSSVR